MKKYLFIAFALLAMVSACQFPDYDYKGSTNPEYPDVTVVGYSVTVFSSNLTDPSHPTFGVTADRETFGSNWVTRKCTYETSGPEITVAAYNGTIDILKSVAMTVTATASGSITVTYPAPVGDKTSTTILVNYDTETGAVVLVSTNN